jgi:hypothetical protein
VNGDSETLADVLEEIDRLERDPHGIVCTHCRRRTLRRTAGIFITIVAVVSVLAIWLLLAFASFPPVGQG